MKIQIASDLHLEVRPHHLPNGEEFRSVADRDLLVLAGDIGTYMNMNALPFIEREAAVSPVIYVPGNHEYYSMHMREEIDRVWRRIAKRTGNLHYLIAERVTIDGVRFWGGPLYSDFFGRRDLAYLKMIRQNIDDFDYQFSSACAWSVNHHLSEHFRQTELLRALAGQVDVVITHWPPTRQAIAPRWRGNSLNGYFVNDQEDLVREVGAKLWISGHVHDSYDCVVGETRCVGNPTGYPGGVRKQVGFKPDCVIEVTPHPV